MIGTLAPGWVRVYFEDERFAIFEIAPPNGKSVIACLLHLPSQLYGSPGSRRDLAEGVVERITEVEATLGHRRTVVFGDFNMNPFEDGMMGFRAFNSTIHSDVIGRLSGKRTLHGRERPMFYNPLVTAAFRHGEVLGTCYYHRNDDVVHYWNLFDQVIVRPDLRHRLVAEGTRIFSRAGEVSLLTGKGIPDRTISDHLPISFAFDLSREGRGR